MAPPSGPGTIRAPDPQSRRAFSSICGKRWATPEGGAVAPGTLPAVRLTTGNVHPGLKLDVASSSSRLPASVVLGQDVAQLVGEGLRLPGVTEFAACEARVMAREDCRLLTE